MDIPVILSQQPIRHRLLLFLLGRYNPSLAASSRHLGLALFNGAGQVTTFGPGGVATNGQIIQNGVDLGAANATNAANIATQGTQLNTLQGTVEQHCPD